MSGKDKAPVSDIARWHVSVACSNDIDELEKWALRLHGIQYDNSGCLSVATERDYIERARTRIFDYINKLVGLRVNVPVSDISRDLGICESFIVQTLESAGLDLDDEEYGQL